LCRKARRNLIRERTVRERGGSPLRLRRRGRKKKVH